MRFRGLLLVAIFAVAFSCKKERPAQGIMTKAQMVDWMMTLYIAEARLLTLPMTRDSVYKIFVPFRDSMLAQKNLQDSTLRNSFQYYLDRPAELESIYDIMIDSLSLREQRLLRAPATP
jgi:hypothetical protein